MLRERCPVRRDIEILFRRRPPVKSLLIQWILTAVALLTVAHLINGFRVTGLGAALAAAAVIGLLNATLGALLKLVTLPLSILTLGLFLLVINSLMILLASRLVAGFVVRGFAPAFWAAALLALLGMVIRAVSDNA